MNGVSNGRKYNLTEIQTVTKINKYKIIEKVKIINNFYNKIFNKKPNFAILGLNPHNFSSLKKFEEKISPLVLYPT